MTRIALRARDQSTSRKHSADCRCTQDVSLTIRPGERRLIIGPNGAGKTTLFNQITGDLPPTAGQIRLFGADITQLAPYQRAHLGLARTYQIITLFDRDTLEHNVTLGLLGLAAIALADVAAVVLLRRSFDRSPAHPGCGRAAAPGGHPVSDIAYGEKRRVELAMALAQKPRVLLLDEPLAGLSNAERATVKALIASIPRETTVVMIEHDMDTALDLAETRDAVELRPGHRRWRAGRRGRGRANAEVYLGA